MNILDYLGKPWVLGEYECWTMVVDFYNKELAIDLPVINLEVLNVFSIRKAFEQNQVQPLFTKIESPVDNCVVVMGRRWQSHVGVYIETTDGPRILHNRQYSGVLCQPITDITKDLDIFGYYEYKKCQ